MIYDFKINCSNCDASYVGQTNRLETRIAEHYNHIRRGCTQNSVIYSLSTDHKINDHEFDWDNI